MNTELPEGEPDQNQVEKESIPKKELFKLVLLFLGGVALIVLVENLLLGLFKKEPDGNSRPLSEEMRKLQDPKRNQGIKQFKQPTH